MMKKTPWKEYREIGRTCQIQTTYGLDYAFARQNNQAPHFSITCEIKEKRGNNRWYDYGGGAAHDEISRHFPSLAKYIKWHLVSTDEPMHYIANAKYWWEMAMGRRKLDEFQRVDPRDAFKSRIVFGAVPGDEMPYSDDWSDIERWLRERLPALMGAFAADMANLGVLE